MLAEPSSAKKILRNTCQVFSTTSNFVAIIVNAIYRRLPMAKANEIKRGMAISYNNKLLLVKDIDIQAPKCSRCASTLYKMRFY